MFLENRRPLLGVCASCHGAIIPPMRSSASCPGWVLAGLKQLSGNIPCDGLRHREYHSPFFSFLVFSLSGLKLALFPSRYSQAVLERLIQLRSRIAELFKVPSAEDLGHVICIFSISSILDSINWTVFISKVQVYINIYML